MNKIDQYFTSPIKLMMDNSNRSQSPLPSTPTTIHQPLRDRRSSNSKAPSGETLLTNGVSSTISSPAAAPNAATHPLSSSPAISKMIVSNMASVISSVEKKQKKQRRKQRKLVEPDICAISNILCNSLKFVRNADERSQDVAGKRSFFDIRVKVV